jgi:putative IMPACT (imprinted ancient) family translation regulator
MHFSLCCFIWFCELFSAACIQLCPSITSGRVLIDRKSAFQGHVATVTSVAEAQAVLEKLYENNKIKKATHNMWAYVIKERKEKDKEKSSHDSVEVIRRENDDDGENEAGSRMAHLLHITGVTNIMVVVSRWYGGILLGASRFQHINTVTREMVEEWKKINGIVDQNNNSHTEGKGKKK